MSARINAQGIRTKDHVCGRKCPIHNTQAMYDLPDGTRDTIAMIVTETHNELISALLDEPMWSYEPSNTSLGISRIYLPRQSIEMTTWNRVCGPCQSGDCGNCHGDCDCASNGHK